MASVSGVSGSNVNSIYGNRNVISGLASGMDTEAMIQNSVSGIQARITALQQKQTKVEWQQDAYRSVIDKLVQFNRKYTSYTSSTNLLSTSFFNRAVITSANGANAGKVAATGKTTSNVQLNGVAQLATSTRYQVSTSDVLGTVLTDGGKRYVQGSGELNLDGKTFESQLSGSISLAYGNKSLSFTMDNTVYDSVEDFAEGIRTQLSKEKITFDNGSTVSADTAIDVTVADGKITFSDSRGGTNDVHITNVSGKLNETLGKKNYNDETKLSSLDLKGKELSTFTTVREQIVGKTMSFTLDGVTKKITLPTADELKKAGDTEEDLVNLINDKLTSAFGGGKVSASLVEAPVLDADGNPVMGDDGITPKTTKHLRFTTGNPNSNLSVTTEVGEALGMQNQETTYLNTGKTLSDLLGTNADGSVKGLGDGKILMGELKGRPHEQKDGSFRDDKGNVVNADGQRLGKDGEVLMGHDLTINGKKIGTYTRDTALETVMLDINSNTDAGVSLNYSKISNQFVFTANESGSGRAVDIEGDLGKALFGTVGGDNKLDLGKDAIVNMTVNGTNMTVTRSSNTFDVDGLSVTVNNTFNGKMTAGAADFDFQTDADYVGTDVTDPVTFTTKADSEKIVTAIKGMVEDYNAMVKAVRDAYATMPAQTSNGSRYEPLTDADMEGMSETAIKNYEEKAKQGVIFGDQDLSSLYSKITAMIAPAGADGAALREMGLSTAYSEGLTTIELDESALRKALDTNPDSVRDAFTKVAGEGSATNGLMSNLKKTIDTYASSEGYKGSLINKAGSKYAPTSLLDNELKSKLDDYDSQIEKWQTKLSDKVDYYTRQFSRLEQLMAQMNSQSSSIMSMMGGTS